MKRLIPTILIVILMSIGNWSYKVSAANRVESIKQMANLAGAIKVIRLFCKESTGVDKKFHSLAENYGDYLDQQQHLMTDSEIILLGGAYKKSQKYWLGKIFSERRENAIGINDKVCREEVNDIKRLLEKHEK